MRLWQTWVFSQLQCLFKVVGHFLVTYYTIRQQCEVSCNIKFKKKGYDSVFKTFSVELNCSYVWQNQGTFSVIRLMNAKQQN